MENFECPICFNSYSVNDGCICCTDFIQEKYMPENHKFCVDCIRGLAKAATTEAPIAKGGIGLPCPVPKCDNVILIENFHFYLDIDIHNALTKRLQHQSIVDAGLNNLVACSKCGAEVEIDPTMISFNCQCGRRQCRNCPRIYDESHMGVLCAELDRQQTPKLADKLSEVVIRNCHKCNLQYIQQDGCNKMTCQCGAKYCYLCKASINDYSHFCRCGWNGTSGQCPTCRKTCPLYGKAADRDNMKMEEIKTQFSNIEVNNDPGPSKESGTGSFSAMKFFKTVLNDNEDLLIQKTYEKLNNSIEDLQEPLLAIYMMLKHRYADIHPFSMQEPTEDKTKIQKLIESCQTLKTVLSSQNSDYQQKRMAVIRLNNCISLNGNHITSLRNRLPRMYMAPRLAAVQVPDDQQYRALRYRLQNFCNSLSHMLDQKTKNQKLEVDIDVYCQLVSNALAECLANFEAIGGP